MAELQIGIDPSGAVKGSEKAKAALADIAKAAGHTVDSMGRVRDEFGRFVPGAGAAEKSIVSMLNPLNMLQAALGYIMNPLSLLKDAWGVFTTGASAILGLLNPLNLLNAAVDLVSGAWGLLTSALSMGYSIISGAAQLMANFTITLQGIASVAISVATVIGETLVGAIKAAYDGISQMVQVSGSFEQAMQNVKSMGVESEAAFESMRAAALKLGQDTSLSASQAADALYALRSAGFSSAESVSALEGTARLAEATVTPLGYAAEAVAATIRQFGLDASESARVANVFGAAIQNSALTMPRIAEAMKYAGTVAGSLSISLEETTAALMVLNNAGIKGEQSGTVLRAALSSLLNPSTAAADAIRALGLSVDQVNPQMVGITGVIDALGKSGASTTDLIKIFGVEAGPGMAALLKAGSGAVAEFQRKITGTDAAIQMSKTQLETYSGALKILQGSWETLQITLGSVFLPVLRAVIGGVTEAVNALNAWVTDTGIAKAATDALNGVLEGATAILKAFTGVATDLSPIMTAIGTAIATAITQFGAFASGVGKSVSESAAFKSAIAAIQTAIGTLAAPFSKAVASFGELGAALLGVNPSSELFKTVVDGLATTLASGANSLASWISSMAPMAEAFGASVRDGSALQAVLDGMWKAWDMITGAAQTAASVLTTFGAASTMAASAVAKIVPIVDATVASISKFVAFTTEGLNIDWGGLVKAGVEAAIEIIKSLPEAAGEAAKLIGPALAEPLSQLAPDLSAALKANDWAKVWGIITESIPAIAKGASDMLVTEAKALWGKYQGPITEFMNNMKTTILAKLNEMDRDIESQFGVGFKSLLSMGGSIAKGIKASVDAVADAGTFYGSLVGDYKKTSLDIEDALTTPLQRASAAIAGDSIILGEAMRAAGSTAATSFDDGFATTYTNNAANLEDTMRTRDGEIFEKWPAAAYNWGSSVATSYDEGFGDSLARANAQADALAKWAESIEAHSPPKVGPLKDIDTWGMSIAESFSSSFVAYMTGKGTESITASINQMSQTAFGIMDQTMSAITAKAQGLTPEMMSRGGGVATTQGAQPAGATASRATSRAITNNSNTAISVNMQNMSPAMMAQMLQVELAKRGR